MEANLCRFFHRSFFICIVVTDMYRNTCVQLSIESNRYLQILHEAHSDKEQAHRQVFSESG